MKFCSVSASSDTSSSSAGPSTSNGACAEKARNIALKGIPLKEKLNKLFHFGESSKRPKIEECPGNDDMEDFRPAP